MLKIFIFIKKFYIFIRNLLKKIYFLKLIKKYIYQIIDTTFKRIYFSIFFPEDLKKFQQDKKKFIDLGGKIDETRLALLDFNSEAGVAKGHYFNQDLLVANFIFTDNPERHIDIGSRIDGFVAHVAAFRSIEVMDIRKLSPTKHTNIKFIQKDIMTEENQLSEVCDSISCLHALEHFGLGRYNDPLDPNGHLKGFNNMVKMLKRGGKLYISFPIGERKLTFNQRRVFSPGEVITWEQNLKLTRFDFVDNNGDLNLMSEIKEAENLKYGCGIYTFIKTE